MAKMDEDQPDVLRVLQSRAETQAFYNKISRVYDLLAERSEFPIRQAAMGWLDPQPGESILEIGSATGHCVAEMAAHVGPTGRVWGIDLSPGMIAVAQKHLQEKGCRDRAYLLCGDALRLPHASSTMDAVFICFTLELFDTPEIPLVLAECHRVLRAGGRIMVAGLSKEGEGGVILQVFEWTHQHFPNLMDCRPIFVARALAAAGFRVTRREQRSMWVPVEIVIGFKDQSDTVRRSVGLV